MPGMYRFSLIVFTLAIAAYFYAPKSKLSRHPALSTIQPAVSNDAAEQAVASAASSGEWESRLKAEYDAIGTAEILSDVAECIPKEDENELIEARTADADSEDVAASHIPSSASAEEIDPALEDLPLFELKKATQRELTRLGCYEAKVDGLWGRKSRRAIAKFNRLSDDNWEWFPSPDLVSTLRAAPDDFCAVAFAKDGNGRAKNSPANAAGQ